MGFSRTPGMGRCYLKTPKLFCDFGWGFTMNLQVHMVFLMYLPYGDVNFIKYGWVKIL